MSGFIIYECKVAVAIVAFYMFYRLLLSKEKMHAINRFVLVSTAVLSFILPFCVITVHKTVESTAAAIPGEAAFVTEVTDLVPAPDYLSIAIIAAYVTGLVIVLAKMAVSIVSAMRIIRGGRLFREEDGVRIIATGKDMVPFSFFGNIVIPEADLLCGASEMITHEMAHIRLRHSFDVLIVEVITAFQWFNPAIWMLRADLRDLHEYEADDAVLRSGVNMKDYQYLLIKKAVGASGYSVTNSFNHSTLKNRITMMSREKSSSWSAWKALYVVPMVGLSLAASARTVVEFTESPVVSADTLVVRGREDTDKSVKSQSKPLVLIDGKRFSYDEIGVIDDSDISNLTVLRGEKAVELYGGDARNGVVLITSKEASAAKDACTLDEVHVVKYDDKENDEPVVPADKLEKGPVFDGNGGLESFCKYVSANIVYPKDIDGKKEGRVIVGFTVGKDRKVKNVRIVKSVSQALDEEAVRVVASSPDWKNSGVSDGKAVDVDFVMPFVFQKR